MMVPRFFQLPIIAGFVLALASGAAVAGTVTVITSRSG
jgi:hypothetical protein